MPKAIDPEVLDVLRRCNFNGNDLLLPPETLERKLYLKTNKVVEALGGRWNRKQRAHVFPSDAAEICADAIVTGSYVDKKNEFDFFETPAELADQLVELAGVKKGDRVLEPEAGGGRIAEAIARVGGIPLCIEIQPDLVEKLKSRGFDATQGDFLEFDERLIDPVDAVVMNPPFRRSQDMAHVLHAFRFLKTGGRLVSVMGTGFTFRQDRKAREFREWLDGMEGVCKPLPGGSFKKSGTMVNTAVIHIQK